MYKAHKIEYVVVCIPRCAGWDGRDGRYAVGILSNNTIQFLNLSFRAENFSHVNSVKESLLTKQFKTIY